MSSHPDADAFVRAILRDPADTTTRLVFADWLEEAGTIPDRAWAHYLRLWVDADQLPPGSRQRLLLEAEAATHAPYITLKLRLPAARLLRDPRQLLRFLPAPNLVADLAVYEVPRPVLEFVPESVARENLLIPLGWHGETLVIAAAEPRDFDLAQKLGFILNRDIVLVAADPDGLRAALDATYGGWEVETVDSPTLLVGFTDTAVSAATPPPSPEPIVRLADLILSEAVNLGSDRIHLHPLPDCAVVRYRTRGDWVERDRIPRRLLAPLAARFAALAGSADELDRSGRVAGQFWFPFPGGPHRCGATVEMTADGPVVNADICRPPAAG